MTAVGARYANARGPALSPAVITGHVTSDASKAVNMTASGAGAAIGGVHRQSHQRLGGGSRFTWESSCC
jgi:hypothetical protein